MRTRLVRTLAAVGLLSLFPCWVVAEDDRRAIDFDWIFSEAGKSAAKLPDRTWLGDGRVALRDTLAVEAERTLEVFDPTTGTRTKLVDRSKALESLNALLEADEPKIEMPWPAAFGPAARNALYSFDDDLFLLDLQSSKFSRLTSTEGEEKSARFSPDGQRIAYVRSSDLYVLEIETLEETRLTTTGSDTLLNGTVSWVYWEEVFNRKDRGFSWSPDSQAIAYLQTDDSIVDQMHYVDFKPNIPRVVSQRYPKTGEPNPRVRAGVIQLETGKTTWADLGVYPYEYLARMDWLPDSSRLALQTLDRPQTTLDLFLVDAATGKASHLLREKDAAWVNLHYDLHFLDDGKRFLWVSDRDGYPHIYLMGLDGKTVGQVTRGDWSVRPSGGRRQGPQAVSSIDEDHDWIYFTSLKKSSIERHLYRIHFDGSGMERLTHEDGTHRIAFSPDGSWYMDAWSNIETPPSLSVRSTDDGSKVTALAEARRAPYEEFELRTPELFTIATSDGFEMPAYMIKPRDFKKRKRYPVVVYVYGGPSAPTISNSWANGNRAYFDQMLGDAGFIVMRVDNRCATAISKTLETTYVGYGDRELNDLVDAIHWLKAQPYVDKDRVGIWGWSGGGSFTLLALTGSEEFRAGIAVAAVSDWRYYDTKWAERFMKRPQDNPEGYTATSHALRAAKLHGRLLLVHGTYDDNVNPQNAWRFADELIEAGKTFDMMIYPMRKHGIRDDAAQRHLYTTMLEFWNDNLK